MFPREADDAVQAIISAIEDTEAAGMTVTGVAEDQVVDHLAAEAADPDLEMASEIIKPDAAGLSRPAQ